MARLMRSLRVSARALGDHPLRTALCAASVTVGIAGVLVLSAVGVGANQQVMAQLDALGRDVLVVTPPPLDARARVVKNDPALTRALRDGDAEALWRASPAVLRVAPEADRDLLARSTGTLVSVNVIGTTPAWRDIRRFALTEGRFFTREEDDAIARVAVLGAQARALLFPGAGTAVGRWLRIGTVPFEVVGVLESKGLSATGTATEDDKIIVPLSTAQRRLFGSDNLKMLYVQLRPEASETEVADVLRARRDLARSTGPVFRIDGQRVVADARLAAQRPLQRMLFVLGGLGLIVAGVGVTATMMLSVRERRREIGVRVAVGARQRDLLFQFFAEAVALSVVGGAGGIALGTITARGVSAWTRWNAALTPEVVIMAVGCTVLLGIIAGIAPARRAAVMDPVRALQ
jgi:ABC-type antimicrobial peptide transport system permease subunit